MERATIDYEYAKAQWRMQRTQAKLSAAQAVLTATASAPFPWNLIPIGFATGIGAAKVAAIQANRPRFNPPRFESGGIVVGSSFSGDNVIARVNSGEMILNRQQQQRLFDMIAAGSEGEGRPIQLHLTLEIDGEPFAEKILDIASRGNQFIRARAVVR